MAFTDSLISETAAQVVMVDRRRRARRPLEMTLTPSSAYISRCSTTASTLHEVLHVLHGVQRKARLTALRATGSEHTLAHLDLEADDLTARIVATAVSWSLWHLKNIEGTGALAFPASMHHAAEGYASVEVPFSAGEMLVMWNRPRYRHLLATSRLKRAKPTS